MAPVGGIISVRNGLVGAIANTGGDPIYRIMQDGVIEFEVSILETQLDLLAVGDPVEINIDGHAPVFGTVRLISPVIAPQRRLGSLRIALETTKGLRQGLFAAGSITTARREGLGVPATAVIIDSTSSYVLHPGDQGVLERRDVTPLLLWDDWIEVRGDLNPGETVVTRAGSFFTPGDPIEPVQSDSAAEPANPESE